MNVDLRNAEKGDRFEARDGEVWTYVKPENGVHVLSDRLGGEASFGHDGLSARKNDDLVLYIPRAKTKTPVPPMPASSDIAHLRAVAEEEDADLVAELKAAAVPLKPGVPGVLPSRALYARAATRIEALLARATKAEAALDEARKVIEPFAKAADAIQTYIPADDSVLIFAHYPSLFGGQTEVRVGHLRAARDLLERTKP